MEAACLLSTDGGPTSSFWARGLWTKAYVQHEQKMSRGPFSGNGMFALCENNERPTGRQAVEPRPIEPVCVRECEAENVWEIGPVLAVAEARGDLP